MMFKRLVAMFLIITLSVAIDDKFFDRSHVPVVTATQKLSVHRWHCGRLL
jgi:hypothetical protein